MSYELELPEHWSSQGWKVKIRDRERLEPPHATLLRRTFAWRLSLRTLVFLDRKPPARQVPKDLLDVVVNHVQELRDAWDTMYPENPVVREGDDDA